MAICDLHMICGCCGCANDWEWDFVPSEEPDNLESCDDDVYIYCNNCGKLHSLNEKANKREQ